jgi:hypothetical protein
MRGPGRMSHVHAQGVGRRRLLHRDESTVGGGVLVLGGNHLVWVGPHVRRAQTHVVVVQQVMLVVHVA